ncbi:tRNA-modifying protein YgfZ [Candidatus Profftia lariciata]|uniref:tRNA-modifying protein YgfZ n=1 Tax=Candidatus Profftia lariciata TaxID=1987921 RepID=UPI001D018530|nr:tRNA-modifying protein YgfZ [Candidatus Profftia lariciata]UDG81802.1 tRNA-modifying protein YgfZ [Candidatus Profftia lariciata]
MFLKDIFTSRKPVIAKQLPFTIMLLNDLQVVNVTGSNVSKYLQGQVTIDVSLLDKQEHILCGHCNAKGKMWCDLRLFHRLKGFSYIIRRDVSHTQIIELKKYAIFSNIVISIDNNAIILGLAGFEVTHNLLKYFFSQLPNSTKTVITYKETTILYLTQPIERYLLITSIKTAIILTNFFKDSAYFNDHQQWIALNIEAGYPNFHLINSGKFTPQATNIQAFNGICFKKGCYIGQEIIARTQYRNANKKSLYWLQGSSTRIPQPGESLELFLDKEWRRNGTVFDAIQLANGSISIQAILNNTLIFNNIIRVCNDEGSILKIQNYDTH